MLMAFDGALSPRLAELHARWRTPHKIMLIQACVCSLLLVLAPSGETLRNAWQLLMDMSTLTLFVPFICMCAVAWTFGNRVSDAAGIVVAVLSMAFAVVPPPGHGSAALFELKLIGGIVLSIAVEMLAYRRRPLRLSPLRDEHESWIAT